MDKKLVLVQIHKTSSNLEDSDGNRWEKTTVLGIGLCPTCEAELDSGNDTIAISEKDGDIRCLNCATIITLPDLWEAWKKQEIGGEQP